MKFRTCLPVLALGIILSGIWLPFGCAYNEGVIQPPLPPVDTNLVFFQADVIPIFNAACNSSGCHNAGGVPPDLSPLNAYDALWEGDYIDTLDPVNSELMQWMLGNRALDMPLSGPNADYNATVLSWISQGAANN